MTPVMRAHPAVLELRVEIYSRGKLWPACIEVANTLVELCPKRSCGWIHSSFGLHVLKRTQEAFDNLLPAAKKFPRVWTIPYNLACYCAQLNQLDDAKRGLQKAMAIEVQTVKRQAMTADARAPAGVYFGTTSGEIWGSRAEGRTWKCLAAHLPEIYAVEAMQ